VAVHISGIGDVDRPVERVEACESLIDGRVQRRSGIRLAPIRCPSGRKGRVTLLLEGLRGQRAVRVPTPRGAFYAFADVSAARAGRDIWDLVLEWLEVGVAVLPGTAFGPEYKDRVRLSLATRREDVAEAARRLREHVASAPGATARAG
jgi:aspartate/methionine/tyrosine aminotransferase